MVKTAGKQSDMRGRWEAFFISFFSFPHPYCGTGGGKRNKSETRADSPRLAAVARSSRFSRTTQGGIPRGIRVEISSTCAGWSHTAKGISHSRKWQSRIPGARVTGR